MAIKISFNPVKEKRKISVGFKHPEKLEGDIIYVRLTLEKPGVMPDADAISLKDFNYRNYSLESQPLMRVNHVTNFIGDLNGYYHLPYEVLLETLQKENDAEVIERFKEDGLELTIGRKELTIAR
ncbi:MAG TPA: hypothetical protein VMC80_02790 [Patescibacteria group bacterium]|nr:hypothetical protein [Patescibacteria group bacterium]